MTREVGGRRRRYRQPLRTRELLTEIEPRRKDLGVAPLSSGGVKLEFRHGYYCKYLEPPLHDHLQLPRWFRNP